MGLDMYLYRKLYVKQWDHFPADERRAVTVTVGERSVELVRPTYVLDEVAYWRKANQVHAWIVRNCADGKDECQEVYVARDKLVELRDLCERVLAAKSEGIALAQLPPQAGFFFGSTDVDEWYWQDLDATVKMLNAALALDTPDALMEGFYYQASW